MFNSTLRVHRRRLYAATAAVALAGVGVQHIPHEREKLSIYSSPTEDIVLVEAPSRLETQIGAIRRNVTQTVREGHAQVQGVVSRWIGVEHAVETRVKSLISPAEPLTPALLYVGIATLSGSIIARSRSLPIRFLLPPTFLVISMHQFLPRTTANISAYFGSLEEQFFPTLSRKHDVANAHTRMTWERIKEGAGEGRQWISRGVETGVEKVQDATGLKLKETFGFNKDDKNRSSNEK